MSKPLILAYHRVCPQEHLHAHNALVVTTKNFKQQLKYLRNAKYQFLTLQQYYNKYLLNNKKSKEKLCIVTFDDGYLDNYLYALPILQKYKVVATFFITTGSIGKQALFYWDYKNFAEYHPDARCMNWEELSVLKSAGMEIGSHTVSHYELTHLPQKQLAYELNHSKKILDKALKQKTISICYPRGNFNNRLLQEVARVGYQVGVLTNATLFDNIEKTNYTLSRIGIYNQDQGLRFRLKLSKISFLIKKILGV